MKRSTQAKTDAPDRQQALTGMPIITTNMDGEMKTGLLTKVNVQDASFRKHPVPMLASEIIRIETAMHFAQMSDKTIRRWSHADGIGRQAEKHGPLQVSFPGLLMKLDGEVMTLERFRSGDRDHPDVQFYLRRAIDLLEQERLGRRR